MNTHLNLHHVTKVTSQRVLSSEGTAWTTIVVTCRNKEGLDEECTEIVMFPEEHGAPVEMEVLPSRARS